METYKIKLANILAETGALFFDDNLVLKDGRPTPYFVNMAMFKTGRLNLEMGSFFAGMMKAEGVLENTDTIVGPSYKGSAIASAAAIAIWNDYGIEIPFDYDRKEAKDHGEASKFKSVFVNATFFDGCRVFVVDDVATSMGTKYELLGKIDEEARAKGIDVQVTGIGVAIDREQTTAVYDSRGQVVLGQKGADAVKDFVDKTGIRVYSVGRITEVVDYLFRERIPVVVRGARRPLDEKTKEEFDAYLLTYGTG